MYRDKENGDKTQAFRVHSNKTSHTLIIHKTSLPYNKYYFMNVFPRTNVSVLTDKCCYTH